MESADRLTVGFLLQDSPSCELLALDARGGIGRYFRYRTGLKLPVFVRIQAEYPLIRHYTATIFAGTLTGRPSHADVDRETQWISHSA